jgi:subtilase family serine protease
MFGFSRKRKLKDTLLQSQAMFESLESRQLLSANAADYYVEPGVEYNRTASTSQSGSSDIQGYTPSQIKTAYDFNNITFGNGTITGDGSGQTIAIVDAYNDPNITADLGVFDSEFGIAAPPSFQIVNGNGGSKLPTTNADWASEISLDVEWAHAIAPGANILLVEANSDSLADLLTAVDTARNTAGVSVVSMSWGGSEFFSFSSTGEFTGETQDDYHFTTPSGHEGITFVAAAGDSGSFSGIQWPSASPNVVSVGGTTLNLDASGQYISEQSWSGTSGGYSEIETTPSYQDAVNDTGARATPDVAYDADPNTGVAVYDSFADGTYVGWQEFGGTSAGAPQWSALIAIADQGRVAAGLGTLDGPSQTLPILYSLYSAPDTSDYSTYTSYFNDVIDATEHNPYQWQYGGYGYSNTAVAGYDTVTGLGTPKADMVIDALVAGSGTSSSGGGTTSGGGGTTSGGGGTTSGGGTTTTATPPSPISATIISTLPSTVVGSDAGTMKIRLFNSSDALYTGAVDISLYATTDGTISSTDTPFDTVTVSNLKLASGAYKTETIHFTYPADLSSGSYELVASAATSSATTPSTAVATDSVEIVAPTVDLATSFSTTATAITVKPGHSRNVAVTIKNIGNVTAVGTVSVSLYAALSSTLDTTADALLAELSNRSINLAAGHSLTLHLRILAPSDEAAGSYYLIASVASATQPSDTNTANNTAAILTA